jgi:hypothetical protein
MNMDIHHIISLESVQTDGQTIPYHNIPQYVPKVLGQIKTSFENKITDYS